MKILDIYCNDNLAGKLWLENKQFCFQYTEEYCITKSDQLSITLPVKREPYLNDYSKPYFSNLLPEGRIRESIEKRNPDLTKGDDFELLEKIGGECAGAIIIMPEGEKPSTDYSYQMIPQSEMDDFIDKIRLTPFLASKNNIRLSLAGAQDKIPVFYDNENIGIPEGNTPSTHIFKPQSQSFKSLVENETFIMTLAGNIGLNVPNVNILQYEYENAYLIERYDRIHENGKIHRLIQEDFCQIMKLSSNDKYNASKGSTFEKCYEIIVDHSVNPIEDREQFLKWIAFNALIGNEDAHSKNISLLYTKNGVKLSPFYDLLNTHTYKNLERGCAMSIGNEKHLLAFMPEHFEQLAIKLHINKEIIHNINNEMIERLNNKTRYLKNEFINKYGANNKLDEIETFIYKAIAKLDNAYRSFKPKPPPTFKKKY